MREERGGKEGGEGGRGEKQRRAGNDRGGESGKGEVDGGREKRGCEGEKVRIRGRKNGRKAVRVCGSGRRREEEEDGSEVAAY